jgi:hypothetical protein
LFPLLFEQLKKRLIADYVGIMGDGLRSTGVEEIGTPGAVTNPEANPGE